MRITTYLFLYETVTVIIKHIFLQIIEQNLLFLSQINIVNQNYVVYPNYPPYLSSALSIQSLSSFSDNLFFDLELNQSLFGLVLNIKKAFGLD